MGVKDHADWVPHLRAFTVAWMMRETKLDLTDLGVHHDVFTSEKALVDAKR